MDTPTDLEQLKGLWATARRHLEAGRPEEAEEAAREALRLEENAPKTLDLLADVVEARGRTEEAEQLRARAKALRKEAWARQVEAELRGGHETLGEAIRHELL